MSERISEIPGLADRAFFSMEKRLKEMLAVVRNAKESRHSSDLYADVAMQVLDGTAELTGAAQALQKYEAMILEFEDQKVYAQIPRPGSHFS
tara:strand:+ start:107 stop:382 length:276 start_codon:yes stop_codon:yes gene_type:complete